jgi:hypothetical protein
MRHHRKLTRLFAFSWRGTAAAQKNRNQQKPPNLRLDMYMAKLFY